MGRTIIAEERVQQQIDLFYSKEEWAIGLIIGQVSVQVGHMLRERLLSPICKNADFWTSPRTSTVVVILVERVLPLHCTDIRRSPETMDLHTEVLSPETRVQAWAIKVGRAAGTLASTHVTLD